MAQNYILKMEADMKNNHDRNVNLMKEMDENYKLIEGEADAHFRDFLEKWKTLAKDKIDRYKTAFTTLKNDKEGIQTKLQTIVHELQEKNKKLIEDYAKLLEKYKVDIESQKAQHKNKINLVETTYDDELSKLKQEKIELEGLFEAMKSQKNACEIKNREFRTKMKEKELIKREQVQKIVDTYANDCAHLVMEAIIIKIEEKENRAKAEELNKAQKSLIDALKKENVPGSKIEELSNNINTIQKQKEIIQEQKQKQIPRAETLIMGQKIVQNNRGDDAFSIVIRLEDQKRYNELVVEQYQTTRKILDWKRDFEKKTRKEM